MLYYYKVTGAMNNNPDVSMPPAEGTSQEDKRHKPRHPSHAAAAIDPLEPISTSVDPGFARFSPGLIEAEELLKERARVTWAISNAIPRSISPGRAETFVKHRKGLLRDLACHNASRRDVLRRMQIAKAVDKPTFEKLFTSITDFDRILSKERKHLAHNQEKLARGILAFPAPARIGEAYLAALTEIQAVPAPPLPYTEEDVKNFRNHRAPRNMMHQR